MIGGRNASSGAIILCCLNLPPELRYKLENVYFAGITPSPNMPDIVTISHVITPIVQQILEFWAEPGKVIPTHRHPQGHATRAAVVPIIADLQAIRKVTGYASVSSDKFCSYCDCTLGNVESLDPASWTIRTADEVRATAARWKAATTKTAREDICRETGVRWSPLHDLPYWDPVGHIVLGFMHNTLEGILQHHCRVLWGIGAKLKSVRAQAPPDSDTDAGEELDDSDAEMEDIMLPAPPGARHQRSPSADEVSDMLDLDAPILDLDPEFYGVCVFEPAELDALRQCIREIRLPTSRGCHKKNSGPDS